MTIKLDDGPVTLTKAERLILANQYTIMSLVDSKNAKYYERSREAVASGYASAIEGLLDHMFDGLSVEECGFVIRAMAMYDALQRSHAALGSDKAGTAGIKATDVSFPGFDGNNETEYMAYARFVTEHEQRFTDLATSDRFNSHMPMRDEYRAMLLVWENEFGQSYELTVDQMKRLLNGS